MVLYYSNTHNLKKRTRKLNYIAPNVLRSIYLIALNPIHHNAEKKIYARGSCIPPLYQNQEVSIHKGKGFKIKRINRWVIGFKFGEFTWNRKIALYKAKMKKKKKK
jgi:ribosomal protein S19